MCCDVLADCRRCRYSVVFKAVISVMPVVCFLISYSCSPRANQFKTVSGVAFYPTSSATDWNTVVALAV